MCLCIQRERSRCEGQCLACDAALLKSTLNITTYLARDLPHPVTAPAEPLLSVHICIRICMRSLRGEFYVWENLRMGKLF